MGLPGLMRDICGPMAQALAPVPAEVQGYRLSSREDCWFPMLLAAQGGRVAGILLSQLPPDVMERLTYFAAGLQHFPTATDVVVEGRVIKAQVFLAGRTDTGFDAAWDAKAWQARWEPLARDAVREMMGHQGRFSAAELPQRLPMILSRAAARQAAAMGAPRAVRSDMSHAMVEDISETTCHAGFFLTREHRLRHPRFDGTMSTPVTREVFVATDAAIVLPYDARRDRVLLVEQFRMGPYGRGDQYPWMLEPVAGRVDPGETPEQTARRECVEEAGLILHGLEHIASYYCSPGCSTEYFHTYLGLCDLPDKSRRKGGLDSEDEDIRTHVLSFDDALRLCSSGEADNGPLILSLIWLKAERERLRAVA